MNIAITQPVALLPRKFKKSLDVIELLKPDVPVLCYSPEILRQQARYFIDKFPGETAYAVKANPEPWVISTLFDSGLRVFDVASPAELALVALHAPGAKMHYHNPVKSRDEIAVAYHDYGCRRFAVDDIGELDKIAQTVGECDDLEIAVRLRLPASASSVHDFSTKFGAEAGEVVALLRECTKRGFTPLITFHPGSQCHDVQAWVKHIKTAAELASAANIRLTKLNIGGGFPARYCDENIPDLPDIFCVIASAVSEAFEGIPPQLECEPGRAIVASCVSLITRVKAVRHKTCEVFINDGIYGSLMESVQAPALTPRHRTLRAIRTLRVGRALEKPFTIYGPTCDPLDRLPLELELPVDICEGEYIEFLGVGAYGSATATGFNGYGGAQVVEVGN